jgi:hypothetical protein
LVDVRRHRNHRAVIRDIESIPIGYCAVRPVADRGAKMHPQAAPRARSAARTHGAACRTTL